VRFLPAARPLSTLSIPAIPHARQNTKRRPAAHWSPLVTHLQWPHSRQTRRDALPTLPGRLQDAKPATRARLYQAFDLHLLYNKEMHQVTIHATITTSTPGLLAAIIADSEPPTPPTRYPFPLTSRTTMGSSSALRSDPPGIAARDRQRSTGYALDSARGRTG
jgi:hypothetical protein